METFSVAGLVFSLTGAIKLAGMPTRFLPLVAILFGGLINPLYNGMTVVNILIGLAIGAGTTVAVAEVHDVAEKIGG